MGCIILFERLHMIIYNAMWGSHGILFAIIQSCNNIIELRHTATIAYGHTPIAIWSPWGECKCIIQWIAHPTMPTLSTR